MARTQENNTWKIITKLSHKINGKGRNARDIRQNMGERILIPLTGKKGKELRT
jgi:hypothetical protein